MSRAGLSFLELLVLSAIRVCQTNTDEEFLAQLKRSVLFLPITTDEAESASILAEFTSVLGDESPDFLKIATPIVDIYASSVIQIVSSLWASSFSTKKDVIASTQLDEIDDEEVMQSVLPEVAFGLCRITFLFLLPYHLREGVRGIECMTLLQQLPERYVSKVLVSVVKVFTRVIRECGLVVQTAINVKRVILSADGDSLLRFSTKRKDPNEGPIITKDSPRSSTLKKSILSHKPDSDWSFLLSILGIFNRHSFTQLIRVLEAIAKGDVQSPASGSKTRAQESLSFVSVHITKLARQILYKVEEFQWKLTQILQYTEGISDQVNEYLYKITCIRKSIYIYCYYELSYFHFISMTHNYYLL